MRLVFESQGSYYTTVGDKAIYQIDEDEEEGFIATSYYMVEGEECTANLYEGPNFKEAFYACQEYEDE